MYRVIVVLVLLALSFWILLFKSPADDELKAGLIDAASGCEEAEIFVRQQLARPNLQRRHVINATKHVESIVQNGRAKATVAAFLNQPRSN